MPDPVPFVQSIHGGGRDIASVDRTLTGTVEGNRLLVFGYSRTTDKTWSITDDRGLTWTLLNEHGRAALWATVAPGGDVQVTVTRDPSDESSLYMFFAEYGSSVVGSTAFGSAGTVSSATLDITVANANATLVAGYGSGNNGWTIQNTGWATRINTSGTGGLSDTQGTVHLVDSDQELIPAGSFTVEWDDDFQPNNRLFAVELIEEEPEPEPGPIQNVTVANSAGSTVASLQFDHNHTAGNFLIVMVGCRNDPSTVTVTYGGVPMTLGQEVRRTGEIQHTIFFLEDPASGVNEVEVSTDPNRRMTCFAISLFGVEAIRGYSFNHTSMTDGTINTSGYPWEPGDLVLAGAHWSSSEDSPPTASNDSTTVQATDHNVGGQSSRGATMSREASEDDDSAIGLTFSGTAAHVVVHAVSIELEAEEHDPAGFQAVVDGTSVDYSHDPASWIEAEDQTEYLLFRRSSPTGVPFDPEVDEPVLIYSHPQTEISEHDLDPGNYEAQVFARRPKD